MNNKYNDIKETALKLESLFNTSPEKYYYLKGYIHRCFMDKEESEKDRTPRNPTNNPPQQSA